MTDNTAPPAIASMQAYFTAVLAKFEKFHVAISIGLFIVSIIAILHSIEQSRVATSQVEQTYQLLNYSENVQTAIFEHKIVNADFHHTQNPSALDQLSRVRNALFSSLAAMQRLTAESPPQQQKLDEIAQLVKTIIAESDRRRPSKGGLVIGGPGISIETEGEINLLGAQLIAKLHEFNEDTQHTLQTQKDVARFKSVSAILTMMLGLLLSMGLLLAALKVLRLEAVQRKHAEAQAKSRNYVLELLASGAPLSVVLDAIARETEKENPAMLCSIMLCDQTGKRIQRCVAPSLKEACAEALHGMEIGKDAAFTGERAIIADIRQHPTWQPFQQLAEQAGVSSCWSEPVFSSTRQLVGVFAIYHCDVQVPTAADLALMEQTAKLASIAIERSQAVQTIEESEARWKFALEGSGDGVWDWNLATDETFYSSRWAEIFGYAEHAVGSGYDEWEKRIHPEDRPQVLAKVQDCLVGKARFYVSEHRAACQDGSYKLVREQGRIAMRGENGTPLRMIGTLTDITERKQAESELKIAAHVFESLEGMFVTDAHNVILRVNQAFVKITGYSAEEAVGQRTSLLKSGRHDQAFYAAMWQSLDTSGSWDGELWNKRKNGEFYPAHIAITAVKGQDGSIVNYVATMNDISQSKAAANEINALSFYDPLTSLPNRRLLMDRLKHAVASSSRSGNEGALLFIDLDNFKVLNDTLGHEIGDLLIKRVAERLSGCVREGDTIARLGGDEFVVMLEDLSKNMREAAALAENIGGKILHALDQPYILGPHECYNTASIGAALFDAHRINMDEILKHADIAMYQAKTSGRNRLIFFDPRMQESINARVLLEGDLRKALEKRQFHLHYQVQVDRTGQPTGAEALIRWIHPSRGVISPIHFIPLAEETDLILSIGQWVLESACAQIKAWEQDTLTSEFTLAVNVSAKQFRQTDFVSQICAVADRHGINPKKLKLELTESLFLEDIGETIVKMNVLQEIGIQFSLDDFGTGYSSLQYLKKLPLDQLKIDKSFVNDICSDESDSTIVSTIVAMASSLKLDVIAEGVETEEQRQRLLAHGCNNFQGYLFGKPLPIEAFQALVMLDAYSA